MLEENSKETAENDKNTVSASHMENLNLLEWRSNLEQLRVSTQGVTWKVNSVYKGELAFMTFTIEGKTVGELWGTGGVLSFTGDYEASAKVFFDNVIELHRDSFISR